MTSLRRQMLEYTQVRNFSPHTQTSYVQQVSHSRGISGNRRSLGPEEIRAYQIYLTNGRKLAVSPILIAVPALRLLYTVTLKKDGIVEDVIPAPKKPQRLPVVLRADEVLQNAAVFAGLLTGLFHRVLADGVAWSIAGEQPRLDRATRHHVRRRGTPRCASLDRGNPETPRGRRQPTSSFGSNPSRTSCGDRSGSRMEASKDRCRSLAHLPPVSPQCSPAPW